MEVKFTVSEVLNTSWKYIKSQIWILTGLFIGYFIISLTLSLFAIPAKGSEGTTSIAQLISLAFTLVFSLGYYKNLFQTIDDIEPQFSAYGQQARKLFTCFISCLLVGIIVSVGTILFIIPGIYLGLRLQFFMAFIVEEDAGAIEALKRSWEITNGQVSQLFLLGLAMISITFVGILLFFVGLLFAAPLVYMMQCYTFRKLNTLTQDL